MKFRIAIILSALLFMPRSFAMPKDWDEYTSFEKEQMLVTKAFEQSDHSSIVVNNQKFRKDCSGFIEAIFASLGHNVVEFTKFYDVPTNGVGQIYKYVERTGSIYKTKLPKPGDLIFFSNTYDMNHDGKRNDELTHVGIVTSLDSNETISFLHVVRSQVRTDYMNLTKPSLHKDGGKIINSYLRREGRDSYPSMLTSQLFDFFGSLNP